MNTSITKLRNLTFFKITLTINIILAVLILFFPLVNRLSFEHSFILAIIASFFSGIFTTFYVQSLRQKLLPIPKSIYKLIFVIFITNLAIFLIPTYIIIVKGIFYGFCNFTNGIEWISFYAN